MQLNEYQKKVIEEAAKTKGKGGFASKSSAQHLKRAIQLKHQMPEISAFLLITAEEEAATALFSALRKRNYDGAEKLKDKNHTFKTGLYPFIQLIGKTVGPLKHGIPLNIFFDPKTQTDSGLRIRMLLESDGYEHKYIIPNPPLNLHSVSPDGEKTDYLKEVRGIASDQGIRSIHSYMKKIANRRNTLLYASDSNVPNVEDIEELFDKHIKAIFTNLSAYLLVEPYQRQNFAQEALTAFIKIQERLEERESNHL